jgi:hypothetical protein
MNERAQACLWEAEVCEHSAQRTNDESARLMYLDLANYWRTLAERVEAMDPQRARLEQDEPKAEVSIRLAWPISVAKNPLNRCGARAV